MKHARIIDQEEKLPVRQAIELFLSPREFYANWLCLYDPESPWEGIKPRKHLSSAVTPLYFVSLAGLYLVSIRLLEKGPMSTTRVGSTATHSKLQLHGARVNVQGGKYSNALQQASRKKHLHIVKYLLENNADINAPAGSGSSGRQEQIMN